MFNFTAYTDSFSILFRRASVEHAVCMPLLFDVILDFLREQWFLWFTIFFNLLLIETRNFFNGLHILGQKKKTIIMYFNILFACLDFSGHKRTKKKLCMARP